MNTLLGGLPGNPTFGNLLRHWRTNRRLTQLDLATEAGISARHLSFLETGRAQPSRDMVQLLAGMLDVPLADRNALLVGAGYAPVFGERKLDDAPELEHVRRALEFTLRQQEPFPALVLDAYHDIVMRNNASQRIFSLFRGPLPAGARINGLRTIFDPNGLRPYIANWSEMAECILQGLQRQIADTGNETLIRLRKEVLAFPDVPERFSTLSALSSDPPIINLKLRKDDLALSFFSAVTFIGRARDITLRDLKIECFFPADAATETFCRRFAAAPDSIAV
ncbi:MAG TPA: helix-turn-helix transcriptional regulator [Vicinamibacterales bacterium]|nr:helix-turn-helix transcriptional regulator [Vicinamibacterales bacterium]